MFASGVASSLGLRVLMLDTRNHLGGDCTNSACVPSKAVRSVARMKRGDPISDSSNDWLRRAREHATNTVMVVRRREDPAAVESSKNLHLLFCQNCRFVNKQEMEILPRNETIPRKITSKKFLIATGASPIIPECIAQQASAADLPVYTYRTILTPEDGTPSLWNLLDDIDVVPQIVIAGGGPTACELGQALARLGGKNWNVTIVAPGMLLSEDMSLQQAAMQLLKEDGVNFQLGKRVVGVTPDRFVNLDDGSILPVDALVMCIGRSPTVANLGLDAAGVDWTLDDGILVHARTLRSKSNPNVFACGDCCSAVKGRARNAAHAGWTGYHAARNIAVPWILRAGAKSVHATVPSVIFSDPELASVGMSKLDCIRKFGRKGFASLSVSEQGMDRGDMDRLERNTNITFVELRVTKITGHILGLTACGPAAAELANEVGVAIENGLTVRDLARSIHAYPSHGYLLYRISLALATSNIWGLLETFGPLGRAIGTAGRQLTRIASALRPGNVLPWKRRRARELKEWEAFGEENSLVAGEVQIIRSYLDMFINNSSHLLVTTEYNNWVLSRPKSSSETIM